MGLPAAHTRDAPSGRLSEARAQEVARERPRAASGGCAGAVTRAIGTVQRTGRAATAPGRRSRAPATKRLRCGCVRASWACVTCAEGSDAGRSGAPARPSTCAPAAALRGGSSSSANAFASAAARARRAVQRETEGANMCSGTYVPRRMEREDPDPVWLWQAKNARACCNRPCTGRDERPRRTHSLIPTSRQGLKCVVGGDVGQAVVGPAAEHRADEALGFAVGLRAVGPVRRWRTPWAQQAIAWTVGDVGRAVVAQHLLDAEP